MSRSQEADELRIRSILRKQGVGPDADPDAAIPPKSAGPPAPPKPTTRPRDWLDDLLDSNKPGPATAPKPADEPNEDDEDEEEQVEKLPAFDPKPGYWPRPHIPAAVARIPDQAEAAISHGTRRLLYNATAAGAGWALGLYQQFAHAIADCAATTSIGGALVLGIGSTALIAHVWDRRTRHWWPGIAWCARIPLATAVLALALWAPAA